MIKIYLIRHAKPDFPNDERYCLGRTDMPIGTLGRLQCVLMAENKKFEALSGVYSSTLLRARDTAAYLGKKVAIRTGLEEVYAGEWDGLSFSQIKKQYGDIYAARGLDKTIPIPGSENIRIAEKRFQAAVAGIAEESAGDVAITAHKTVIQSLAAALSGVPLEECRQFELPYCSYTLLEYDGLLHLTETGVFEKPLLNEKLCRKLLREAGASDDLEAHCSKVAEKAMKITDELSCAGLVLGRELIYFSSLLHDIARSEPGHADIGAKWLFELGYNSAAGIIRQHHDIEFSGINEAAVVYIADKCVRGACDVTLEKRFSGSLAKCTSPGALEAHKRRYDSALKIKNEINRICGKEAVV